MRRSLFFLVNFSPVFMPALSPSMESGTIVEWKKKVGELVNENDVFCTVQTDKAVVDYTNTFEPGYLAKIYSQNGATVTVAKTIAVMVSEEADIGKADKFTPDGEEAATSAPAEPAAAAPTKESPAASPAKSAGTTSEPPDGVSVTPVFMPALSPSMESGTIVEWKKKVGELVNENDVFCTVQTDKAVVDYTNTFEPGYLAKIYSQNGATVTVAKTIAVMVSEEADIGKLSSYVPADIAGDAPQVTAEPAAAKSTPSAKPTTNASHYGGSLDEAIKASGPSVMRIAANLDRQTLEKLVPTGKGGRFSKMDFVGQPGFNYEDQTPVKKGAAPAAAKSGGAVPSLATSSVLVKAYPVYNLKVSDTTLLGELLRTMPIPKPKPKKEAKADK